MDCHPLRVNSVETLEPVTTWVLMDFDQQLLRIDDQKLQFCYTPTMEADGSDGFSFKQLG